MKLIELFTKYNVTADSSDKPLYNGMRIISQYCTNEEYQICDGKIHYGNVTEVEESIEYDEAIELCGLGWFIDIETDSFCFMIN